MDVITDVSVFLGDGKALGNLDTKNPFVTVQVDSARINSTFSTIIEALSQVRVVVSQVCEGVEANKKSIAEMKKFVADFHSQWENDPRITQLNDKVKAHNDRLAAVEEALANMALKIEHHESRLVAQESKKIDLTPLETAISLLKGDLRTLSDQTGEIAKEMKGNALKIRTNADKIVEVQREGATIAADLKALYDIFEMNDGTVKALVRDPANTRKGQPVKALTDYILSLPSFQTLRTAMEARTSELEDSLLKQLYELKRKIADDMAVVKSKIADKLDAREFEGFKVETEASIRQLGGLAARIDRLSGIVDSKAPLEVTQKQYDHLMAIKADKGDTVGFLAREDIEPLERDLRNLAQALDALGGKVHVEERQLKLATPPVAPDRTPEPDRALSARVSALEISSQALENDKVGKAQLADVYMYVDNGLANLESKINQMPPEGRFGITPDETTRPTSAKRYGQLKPLTRPPSAGGKKDEELRATIPEQVRSPTPPISYTSSPAKLVPSLAKWRATAALFDVDGHRTNASVTAVHAVSFEEHVENVRRSVAGEEIVPPEFITHIMK